MIVITKNHQWLYSVRSVEIQCVPSVCVCVCVCVCVHVCVCLKGSVGDGSEAIVSEAPTVGDRGRAGIGARRRQKHSYYVLDRDP